MSKTLFWYVFRDLLKVFFLASGVLAGIMSFGGLFKPLTEQGLGAGQIVAVIGYLMPAMTTYSYPVAALFATTIVYGRLAADNEVTAVRAAGISLGPLGMGFPALVLGFVVAVASLLFLSYIVPTATLQVEKTIFSNLAQLLVNRIDSQHQIKLQQANSNFTIYARGAHLGTPADVPADALQDLGLDDAKSQVVTLDGVSIVTYSQQRGAADDAQRIPVPDEFYLARRAVVVIQQPQGDGPLQMRARLFGGSKFPREVIGGENARFQVGVRVADFPPQPLPSPIRENTKFMTIASLQELHQKPEQSRRIGELLSDYVRQRQGKVYLADLAAALSDKGAGGVTFKAERGEVVRLEPASIAPKIDRGKLILQSYGKDETDLIHLIQSAPGQGTIERTGREARVRVYPDNRQDGQSVMVLTVELIDPVLTKDGQSLARDQGVERTFTIAMPPHIAALADASAEEYLTSTDLLPADQRQQLYRNLLKQDNSVISEMHARIAFGLSCLVLVLVGYGLGVTFKSGNYLTAFAVSVVPALLSIVLIVTGQHVAENVPWDATMHFKNPLATGLVLIWSGNAAVLLLAGAVLWRLRRA